MTIKTENINKELLLSREASSDIEKNRICKDVGPNTVAMTGAGEKGTSISRYKALAGTAASQQYAPSVTLLRAGGTIPAMGEYVSGADGVALTAVGAASDVWVLGQNIGAQVTAGHDFSAKQYGENSYQVP